MKKVYIIGNIPEVINENCELKFYKAQMALYQRGFSVVNPIERLSKRQIDKSEAMKKNLRDLILCDAVFILPCVNLTEGKKNLEIMYALNFNLIIMHGVLDLSSDEPLVQQTSVNAEIMEENSNS